MSGNFGTVNPLHYAYTASSPEMTEISIEEQNNVTDYKESNTRPATLPVSSPFGPPGLSLSSYSANNGVGDETGSVVTSNSCVTLASAKATPIGKNDHGISVKNAYATSRR